MGRKEGPVEASIVEGVRELKGYTRKVVYQGRTGAADRWCFFPGGRLLMLEAKSAGKPLAPDQRAELKLMRSLGFWVAKVDSREQVAQALACSLTATFRAFNEAFPLSEQRDG
jgi:hypothetical protein